MQRHKLNEQSTFTFNYSILYLNAFYNIRHYASVHVHVLCTLYTNRHFVSVHYTSPQDHKTVIKIIFISVDGFKVKCIQMYRNKVPIGVQCTQKVYSSFVFYMYRNIVSVVVRCTQKVYMYMYRNIVLVIGFCTLEVHFHSVCYRFLYIGCTLS